MTAADLRAWRRDFGMNRKQAAAALGVSWRTIAAWEIGRKIPTWIELLTRELNIGRLNGRVTTYHKY